MTTTEYWDEIEERLGTVGLQLSDGDGPHLTVTLPDGNGNPASILVEQAPGAHPLNQLAAEIHDINVSHGWDFDASDDDAFATKVALIHAELSEALEERRDHAEDRVENGKPEGVGPELADVLIRTLHLMHKLGVDIDGTVRAKVAYNRTRSFRHGRAF